MVDDVMKTQTKLRILSPSSDNKCYRNYSDNLRWNTEWTVKEEALRIGEELLNKMPEIKEKDKIRWNKKGAGQNFRLLCTLLKENAVPMKTLIIHGIYIFIRRIKWDWNDWS